MNLEEIKRELTQRVVELARHLFPQGKRVGNHWCVGSIAGEPGQSFKICVAGERVGLWGDFDGTQRHRRSLVDLWIEKRGVDFEAALHECAEWLGVTTNSASSASADRCDSNGEAAPKPVSFNWRACVEAFQETRLKELAQSRGYSVEFCSWLRDHCLIGLWKDCIAFPVHDDAGRVIGCHFRTKTKDWFFTENCAVRPLIIGNLAEAAQVHVFESQWDAFAVCEKLRFHEIEGVAVIVTRGAGNGGLIGGLIPPTTQFFAWKQNDEEKRGKRAGDEWLKTLVRSANAIVRCVLTPAQFKDPNEWTWNGAATCDQLLEAMSQAKAIESKPGPIQRRYSLNSPVLAFALQDDYPQPPASAAFYGLAGEIVRRIEPHTEADSAALLFQLLAAVGSIVGHDIYFVADGARHHLSLYGVLVGQSSKGRKGTSWNHIAKLFGKVDPEWLSNCVTSGLSSGEGLIWEVRDPIEETKPIREKGRATGAYETFIANHGNPDKRLLIIEGEFANVLKVMGREGNTLSPIIRSAWDSGNLKTMVKTAPAKATGAHISFIGHVTRDELRRLLTKTESANGFANRFCWLAVKRSKCLPDGGAIDTVNFDDVVAELKAVFSFAEDFVQIERDPEARELWHAIYPELSEGKPGMAGAVTGRAEAQVVRISAIYALLDKSKLIRRAHLEAALALWDYCERSATWIFGTSTGDRNADKILRALRHAENGLTKTEISSEVFNRHAASAEIDEALRLLHGLKMVIYRTESTDGAPLQRWFYNPDIAK